MSTLTMPLDDAMLASKALLNHVSKDDITPIICQAAAVVYRGNRYLVATDRYSIGRFLLGDQDVFEGDFDVMIPRGALLWISKIVPKGLRRGSAPAAFHKGGYEVRFTWSAPLPDSFRAGEIQVAIVFAGEVERSQMYDVPYGTYPPVAGLWREDDVVQEATTQVSLSYQSLSKIAADIALFEGKNSGHSVILQMHSPDGKIAPVQYRLGDRWTAVVQPNRYLK